MEPLDWAAAGLKVGLLVLVQSELKKLRERAHGLSFHKVTCEARTELLVEFFREEHGFSWKDNVKSSILIISQIPQSRLGKLTYTPKS